MKRIVSVALPKGRLGEKAYSLMERAGYGCPALLEDNRKLTFENEQAGVRYFWVKPSDVPIYVERGAADVVDEAALTPEWLAAYLAQMLRRPERLARLREASRKEGVRDGTAALATLVEQCGRKP